MSDALRLSLTDYQNEAHWRWVLSDAKGKFLADHEVALDTGADEYDGFADLPHYLWHNTPPDYVGERRLRHERELMDRVGAWASAHVFGGLVEALRSRLTPPATVVCVGIPPKAQALLFRPFELAHLDGRPLAECGVRLVYQALAPAPSGAGPEGSLRVLAVFSLPSDARPLNLRRERYTLKCRLETIAQTRGVAIELRIVQYGATRETLRAALEEDPGWDIVHFSGHGLAGELALEKEDGALDEITGEELLPLLRPTQARLKLLTLSACLSGAASVQEVRAELGLEDPARVPLAAASAALSTGASAAPGTSASAAPSELQVTGLPSLAQTLAAELDCAALAMRYPVGDEFAANLLCALFDRLVDKKRSLPDALQLALTEALDPAHTAARPPLSAITPILFGPRAASLRLAPPPAPLDFEPPAAGLALAFPPEPERFVGRLLPMLRASQALAPASPRRGVLFYGMAGAGKTACALELTYRHEHERFTGYVWHKAPDQGADIQTALADFLLDVEVQLDLHDLALTAYVDEPAVFERRTLPRLKALLTQHAILIVLDNVESLLTASDAWRVDLWDKVVDTLLSHTGPSRLVLTSRRRPATLAEHPRLLREPIHALSLGESVLLARQLPHLRPLFDTAAGCDLLTRTLGLVQGHPKLLELADSLATEPDRLEKQLASPLPRAAGEGLGVGAFFTTGETSQEAEAFVATLGRWAADLAATLPPAARLLLEFLCRLEEPDRITPIVEPVWPNFLKRLATLPGSGAEALPAGPDLASALAALVAAGLVESVPLPGPAADLSDLPSAVGGPPSSLRIHPAIAETILATAGPARLAAADDELGNYWGAVWQHGMDTELQGGGPLVVEGGKRAAPYLLRRARWGEAGRLLEDVTRRDTTPATLALALPRLRQVVAASQGTEDELASAGVLANVLLMAGRTAEAEQIERDRIAKCITQGNYRLASVAAGQLLNLLRATGRFEEGLALAEEKAGYTRRAGLGPWTQLADEGYRLQILNALGRSAEVLAVVQELRGQMAALSEHSEAQETYDPWNVREGLLDAGRQAALYLKQWQTALDLNAERVEFKAQRGADAVEMARARFNDYGPLLRLGRYGQARALLEACRAAFEPAHAISELGAVFTALAELEYMESDPPAAARFEQTALRYKYQAGSPGDCAISHNNLASYLERAGAAPEAALAHQLAAGAIFLQTGSGYLSQMISNLALSPLPAAPPRFAAIIEAVEQIEGVRFGALYAALPARLPDGEAAIAALWQMVQEEKAKREAADAKHEQVKQGLAGLPPSILAAFEAGDAAQFKAALEQLAPDEQQAVMAQMEAIMRQAGLGVQPTSGPDMARVLREFEPLLRGIAAVARGDPGPRAQIKEVLPKLEENGWRLSAPVQRIWAGERDAAALTAGLDEQDTQLVRRILELI
jgi:hypothetical protein